MQAQLEKVKKNILSNKTLNSLDLNEERTLIRVITDHYLSRLGREENNSGVVKKKESFLELKGIWKDRADIKDSVAYVKGLRDDEETRYSKS